MKTKSKTKNFREILMTDSDSEDDAVMDTVLVWKNNDTIIHAGNKRTNNTLTHKRPLNILPKNMTTFRDRPHNFSRQNDVVNNSYMYKPIATSPTSVRSDVRSLNFRGFSQKSIADGTESMISEAPTNVSCAFDIASAIKGGQYTASEAKMITDAVMHKFGKRSIKSGRVKKRRVNKKDISKIVSVLLKALDNDNSDDQSTTSISSEECTSVRSGYPSYNSTKRNVSYAASLQNYPRNFDLSVNHNAHQSKEINNSIYSSSRSENFNRKSFRNMYALGPPNPNKQTQNNSFISMPPPSTSIVPVTQLKNKTISNTVESIVDKTKNAKKKNTEKNSDAKSPTKTSSKPVNSFVKKDNHNQADQHNNFESCHLEPKTPEKVISYSKPSCNIDLLSLENNNVQKDTNKNSDEDLIFTKPQLPTRLSNNLTNDSNQTNIDENTSELTKSSFMRRKLFTQTLEITENRECRDNDHSRSNSPLVNIYANDKSKKSSYSMRNSIEDNNRTGQHLLDLVKKIVPAEDMKIITEEKNSNSMKINTVNKKQTRSNSFDQLSDTFTDDEDIFILRNKANDTCILKPPQNLNKTSNNINITKHQPVNNEKVQNSKKNLFIKSSALKLKNTIQKVVNVDPKQSKTKNGINNKSRFGINRKNITTRKANQFWETDTENEGDITQNESIDYGENETGEMCEAEVSNESKENQLNSDESKENQLNSNPEENKSQISNKYITNFESELDDLFRRNPQAYKNHMLKVIKESNPQSKPKINSLIVNIEKCLDINNTIQTSKEEILPTVKLPINNPSSSNVKNKLTKGKAGKQDVKRNSPNTRSTTKFNGKINSPRKFIKETIAKSGLLNVRSTTKNEIKRNSPNTRSNMKNHTVRPPSNIGSEGKRSSSKVCTKGKHEIERCTSNLKPEVKRSSSNVQSNNNKNEIERCTSNLKPEVKRSSSNVRTNNNKHEIQRSLSNVQSNAKCEVQKKSLQVRANNKHEVKRSPSNIRSNLKNINNNQFNGTKNQFATNKKQPQEKTDKSLEDTPTLRPRRNRTLTPQSNNVNKTPTINNKRSRTQRVNDSLDQSTAIRSNKNNTTSSYNNSIIINNKRITKTIVTKCRSKAIVQELTPIRPKRSKAANLDDSFILTDNNKRRKYF